MEDQIFQLQYAMDTFYFLVCGALVMWMAAGFSMLEAGLVRSKNTTEILTKNVALFAISCTMYMACGYAVMYPELGNSFLAGITGDGVAGGDTYAPSADFFFQVVFVATAMSIVSGAVAERMKLWAFLAFAVVMTGYIYPMEGNWTWGGESVFGLFALNDIENEAGEVIMKGFGFSDFAGSGIVHMAGAAAALAGVLLLGARKGKYGANGEVNAIPGANLPMATLGTFILWLGWFGFNGGSVLALASTE
ncbi:MAG: ammonium transporter, partial [Bermanella sp.]